jgi:hypothetical protein
MRLNLVKHNICLVSIFALVALFLFSSCIPSNANPLTPTTVLTIEISSGEGATLIPTTHSTPLATRGPAHIPLIVPTATVAQKEIIDTKQEVVTADEAIDIVQKRFPEVSDIEIAEPPLIGVSSNITVLPGEDGWDLVFWKGTGDCEAGCLNDHYWYFAVDKTGVIKKAGEFERIYDAKLNDYMITGYPLWGVPH